MTPQNTTTNDFPCNCCKRKFSTHQALGAHQKAHQVKQIILQKRQPWSRARHSHVGLCTLCMGRSAFGHQVTSAIEQAYLMRLRQLAALRRRNHSEEPSSDDADYSVNSSRQEPESDGSASSSPASELKERDFLSLFC